MCGRTTCAPLQIQMRMASLSRSSRSRSARERRGNELESGGGDRTTSVSFAAQGEGKNSLIDESLIIPEEQLDIDDSMLDDELRPVGERIKG